MTAVQRATPAKTSGVTPTFRGSYLSVFKTAFNKLSNKNEFSVEALFAPGEDMSGLKAMAQAAMVEKFGADQTKWPAVTRSPFRDQKEKMKDGKLPDGCTAGAVFMRFKSETRPGVVDQNKQEILDDSKVYSGAYLKAHVNAFAFQKGANVGVSFGLNHVQLVKDGEPFSGRPKAEDAFTAVEGTGTTDASSLF